MVVNFSFEANKYFNDSEPWSLKKKDTSRMETILFVISEQIKNISILLNPIIPDATGKILDIMNINKEHISIESINESNVINHEKELKDLKILFKKIEDVN
jgi:methionyl-tRNA synthetase